MNSKEWKETLMSCWMVLSLEGLCKVMNILSQEASNVAEIQSDVSCVVDFK